ncbi:helix-turn-helix domain-containing protein [Streptomyces sp. SBT349]|uniref:helix-turn-helix domain-containing protein n=1 Tax=Streptomyces sp. SBT349 TaxID=1580539 RepID=UPI00066A85A6|nr:pyridoxamine 5'-phosphate oxidase family protein [Streptomyces sp. SBT349]
MVAGQVHGGGSDVGRRVALRREQLGLSREDVAGRAGVAPQYLRYLEERTASPSLGALTRVARALETTVAELSGAEAAAGRATHPADHTGRTRITELDTDECHRLLGSHHIGRVAVSTPEGPAIVPVNYALLDGAIVFRTAPGAGPSYVRDADETAFEVDHLDETQSVGWSVLVVGATRQLTAEDEVERAAEAVGEGPWEPDRRALWVRLRPARVTGRRAVLVHDVR